MRNLALALVASLGLFGCGGAATNGEAKSADDANVWGNFKGTYSQPAEPRTAKAEKSVPAKKESIAKEEAPAAKAKEAPKAEEEEERTPLFTAPKKPASKGSVKGESVSAVSLDQLSASVAAATKGKVTSSGTMTGARYEVVTVESKKATIKIIRPAVTPNAKGPEITPPTNKLGDIAKNESAWFDEEGDVIVVVSAAKKATAAKILNAIVKR